MHICGSVAITSLWEATVSHCPIHANTSITSCHPVGMDYTAKLKVVHTYGKETNYLAFIRLSGSGDAVEKGLVRLPVFTLINAPLGHL